MQGKALRRAFSIVALVVVASIFTVGRAHAGGNDHEARGSRLHDEHPGQ
jgi:hypothetical protein